MRVRSREACEGLGGDRDIPVHLRAVSAITRLWRIVIRSLLVAATALVLATIPSLAHAGRSSTQAIRVARMCPNFSVAQGTDSAGQPYHLRATHVRRVGRVSCKRVRYMLIGTYTLDRGHVYRPPVGRASVSYRGGWVCGNGAGGAGCRNRSHHRWKIEAWVGY